MSGRKAKNHSGHYFLATFGCQMNISDSEKIAYALEQKEYQRVYDLEKADLVVVNMCSVRRSAADRINGLIAKIGKVREKNPRLKSILTGCFLKHPEQRKFFEFFDQVCSREKILGRHYLFHPAKCGSSYRAFVPIMTGCNNFCSYCVVPYTRGREHSQSAKEIIKKIKSLVEKGYKEIWLLGQNVNSYRDQISDIGFADLLTKINELKGDFWIYFTSSHPKDLDDQLIETMARSFKLAPYLNLPVQSGDNTILKKMNRPYNVSLYQSKIKKLRQAFNKYRLNEEKRIALSTDLIVGFPGETKSRFQRTVQLMEIIEFDMAYISRYSPRPLTRAWAMPETVDSKEKKEREIVLNEVLKKTAKKANDFYLGLTLPVLIEKTDSKKGWLLGKTRSYKTIKVKGKKSFIGQIVWVEVEKALSWGLGGKIKEGLPKTSGRPSPNPRYQVAKRGHSRNDNRLHG